MTTDFFTAGFKALTGHAHMRWQRRLFDEYLVKGELPSAVSIPTGLGKTAVMAIWLLALAQQMKNDGKPHLPRRLVYVVDRRAVVDQATRFAEALRKHLAEPEAKELAQMLGLVETNLPISTLRGQYVDNREWLEDPAKPAIVVGTVDMIGSRLLFEGYGVSRKMRPYHAGLLGADTLVLLDEAHLVPPFEALLVEISENIGRYGPQQDDLKIIIPKLHLLPLSATAGRQTDKPFALLESDFRNPDDEEALKRLSAKKRLTLLELGDEELGRALAEKAWGLSGGGTMPARVIVYCNSRDIADSVKDLLKKKTKGTVAEGCVELLVGARRVKEREDAEKKLRELGFLAGTQTQHTPSFLVATSAGEVGVDLDADHMVCDLVAWERMVQRLGRVNRRGGEGRQAEIVVIDDRQPKPKKPGQPTTDEVARIRVYRGVQQLLDRLGSESVDDNSVSPEVLWRLSERARTDECLSKLIVEASSQQPLRPALNRALMDAWAMTSLPEHTGRPEVEPWLRGWVDEWPQTTVAWRRYFPVRSGTAANKKETEDFFEAAPIHLSETLETESYRVMKWLQARAGKLNRITDGDEVLNADDVVAILLKADGSLARRLRLSDLLGDSKDDKTRYGEIERDLSGKTLVMSSRFGGLSDGLLNDDISDAPATADYSDEWLMPSGPTRVIRFRILNRDGEDDGAEENEWCESLRFDLERSAEGEVTHWLSVQKWRDTSNTEDDRATGRPQALAEHQSWAAVRVADIGKRLCLPEDYIFALTIAARLHDEGKRAQRWQRAFRAERDAIKLGIAEPLAKTRGPINQSVLGGYRHEFGSLLQAEKDSEFRGLSAEQQDLVLHLIAAHHGFARPLISTEGCEDAPPLALEAWARNVALRFARLQKRWGPWGLAWWEALLRAADAQASRLNDARKS